MLYLPDVTLVCYECAAHDLAVCAVISMMEKVTFGKVLFYSDKSIAISDVDCRQIPLVSRDYYEEHVQKIIKNDVETTHFIFCQWDSGIVDINSWTDEFLKYDYIGAPWLWYKDEYKVGNGGFALWSTRLWNYAIEHADEFPKIINDHVFCRHYRPKLEELGFKWAPLEIAMQFSFERSKPYKTFGFHGCFNMPFVLERIDLEHRIMLANEYVMKKSEWHEMLTNLAHVYA